MFASRQTLREYTGRTRRSAVIRHLHRLGHRFSLDADLWPKLLQSSIERELGPAPAVALHEINIDAGHCCEAFAEAARPGDDADPAAICAGWSFWRRPYRRAWSMDSCRGLKPIRLCPWCGRKLIIARPREVEAWR